VGKTWKDDKVVSRHKKGARLATLDMDLRTRAKPLEKKERGGGKNWRLDLDDWLEETYDDKYEGDEA
jgi:hypothetical protein